MVERTQPSCSQREYRVTTQQLPISCPTDDMMLWNAHPRVFLPLSKDNPRMVCPYCGMVYVLDDEKNNNT